MPTVEEVSERVREIESRVIILDALVAHIDNNYVSEQNAQAELRFLREDGGAVPQSHIADTKGTLLGLMEEAQLEIGKLKEMPVEVPKPQVAPAQKLAKKAK